MHCCECWVSAVPEMKCFINSVACEIAWPAYLCFLLCNCSWKSVSFAFQSFHLFVNGIELSPLPFYDALLYITSQIAWQIMQHQRREKGVGGEGGGRPLSYLHLQVKNRNP